MTQIFADAEDFDLVTQIVPVNYDGIGADTLGFAVCVLVNPTGLPGDFDDVAFDISTLGFDWFDGEVCIDTCWFPPTGAWMWNDGSDRFTPSWDGPHCFPQAHWNSYDWDGDGWDNWEDPCPEVYGWWPDPDWDGLGDYCDNCPDVYNPDQSDINDDGIGDVCCCFERADMDGIGTEPDIADLIYLVAYMFQEGPPLVCIDHGDLNADGEINIADLIGLVSYMFGSGFEIVPCPA